MVGDRAPCLVLCDDRLPVALAACHQCPDHPGGLVGQRNRCNLGCSPRHQLHEPWPPGPVPFGMADDRHGADHEQLSQVAIAGLGDAAELLLAPLEFCFGTSPIQAERQRPDLNACASATVATNALVSSGPTPGISISLRPSSVSRALARTLRSFSSICAFTTRS